MARNSPLPRRISPVTAFIRSLEGEWFSLAEAARAIDRPEETLRDWARRDPEAYGAHHSERFGQRTIYLYDIEGIERIRKALVDAQQEDPLRFAGRPGRPRIWSNDERRDRERRMAQVVYYRKRVPELLAAGKRSAARKASKRAHEIAAQLEHDRAKRRASIRTRMV
jgi:hypothetical protein